MTSILKLEIDRGRLELNHLFSKTNVKFTKRIAVKKSIIYTLELN